MKGIYKIQNKANNKVYVGQSVDIFERKDAHFEALRSKRHYNNHLQKSFDRYGESAFEFLIIEETEELDEREKHWISFYQSTNPNHGYNLCSGGKKFKMNESTKEKISNSLKIAFRENESLREKVSLRTRGENNPFYGKTHDKETVKNIIKNRSWYTHSEETKKKMSDMRRGENHPNYGKKFNDEWKRKLSDSHKGQKAVNKIAFSQSDIDAILEMYRGGKNLKEIATVFNVSNVPIRRVLTEKGVYKQKNPRKHLTDAQLQEIKDLLESGKSLNSISKLYGFSPMGLKKKLIKNNIL